MQAFSHIAVAQDKNSNNNKNERCQRGRNVDCLSLMNIVKAILKAPKDMLKALWYSPFRFSMCRASLSLAMLGPLIVVSKS